MTQDLGGHSPQSGTHAAQITERDDPHPDLPAAPDDTPHGTRPPPPSRADNRADARLEPAGQARRDPVVLVPPRSAGDTSDNATVRPSGSRATEEYVNELADRQRAAIRTGAATRRR